MAAHLCKAHVEAAFRVLFQRNTGTGTGFLEELAEKGIIGGGFALDYGVIVIQNKAWIFQHRTASFRSILPENSHDDNKEISL